VLGKGAEMVSWDRLNHMGIRKHKDDSAGRMRFLNMADIIEKQFHSITKKEDGLEKRWERLSGYWIPI